MDQQILNILLNNILSGFAALMAIAVWTKTRDSAWIFVVLSVLFYYAAVIYHTLVFFGIILSGMFVYYGIDAVETAAEFLPVLFLITALIIKAVKNMRR